MSFETLLVDVADQVAVITLNRPDKRNAMSPQLHEDMTRVLDELRYDPAVSVVVITGSGKAFSAGMDLKAFFTDLGDDPAEYDRIWRKASEWRGRTLANYPKPTIAMVNGYCFGGAFSILDGCDLAIASDDATFGLSEINFKLFPGGPVSKSLSRMLRPRDALWYALTGRSFDGAEAARIGLVNLSVPSDQLREETMSVAREIAGKDPVALKAAKEAFRFSAGMDWDAAMSFSAAKEAEVTLRQSDGWRKEGIGDFLEGKYRPGLQGHESS